MPGEFQVGGRTFRYGQMDAITQIEIVARLISVGEALKQVFPRALEFARMARAEAAASEAAKASGTARTPDEIEADATSKIDAIWGLVGPVAAAVSRLSKDDKEFIIAEAMRITERQMERGTGWEKIWNSDANRFQFHEMRNDGPLVMQVTLRVLGGVLGGFFNIAPLTSDRA